MIEYLFYMGIYACEYVFAATILITLGIIMN